MSAHHKKKDLRNFAYLIFDLDGTIADSLSVWQKIDEDFLARRGILCDETYLQAVRVKRMYESALYTIERYGLDEHPDDVVQEWMEMALVQYRDVIQLRPGVVSFLAGQVQHGKKLAICTASDRSFVEALLKRYDILPLFDVIVCAQEHELGKNFPDIWRYTAQAMHTEPNTCVVFEDTLGVLEAAQVAGCTTIAIEDAHAAHERDDLKRIADYYFYDFYELAEAFKKV